MQIALEYCTKKHRRSMLIACVNVESKTLHLRPVDVNLLTYPNTIDFGYLWEIF